MVFAEKYAFCPKSNFSSDLYETDLDFVYFVAKIVCVKSLSISSNNSMCRVSLIVEKERK